MNLSEKQKERIRNAIESGSLNFDTETENLIKQGFTKESASLKINEHIDLYKEMLFEKAIKSEEKEERRNFSYIGIVTISSIGPIIGITSPFWYVATIFIAAGLGYWAYKDIPIAGVSGSICLSLVLPLIYSWYISGRSSIIKIEILIPIGISVAISYFIGWLILKTVYNDGR